MVRANSMWQRCVCAIAVVLMGLLTACGGSDRPPQAVIEQAIQLQVEQTQTQLSQQLFRSGAVLPSATIDHVKVKKQRSEAIESQTGYRIEGTYDLMLDAPQQITRRQNPFEVYLQRDLDGNWSLARPLPDGRWDVRSIPIIAPEEPIAPAA